jgi:hypothetical protein
VLILEVSWPVAYQEEAYFVFESVSIWSILSTILILAIFVLMVIQRVRGYVMVIKSLCFKKKVEKQN